MTPISKKTQNGNKRINRNSTISRKPTKNKIRVMRKPTNSKSTSQRTLNTLRSRASNSNTIKSNSGSSRTRTARSSYQYGSGRNPRRPKGLKVIPSKTSNIAKNKKTLISPPEKDVIRIVPLGGVEEIGKNMTAIEIGNDIIVVDAGMQLKTKDTPGIDYMIPNTTYLEERKDRIRGIFITHGHLDHIGGIPLVASRIGNPPIYSRI